ncbi:inhibitor of apoptosis-promoting Bax1-domain-containing protein [Glomus cerebriforme]|uniref:Inhibitor of apoptosis-promoting Bax1-domain-containing protein n=1 Tax=Glomus cerebriforme TaxID=658196 RepID=A0A397TCB8_9GLOM|nr:inhibitor of apoptosis-promoting Bax1-domain-containing protein [Glomus cerebriforme]
MASNLGKTLSNPNNENKNNNANNNYNIDNEQQQQTSLNAMVSSGDSMSMTSSFSHSHLETDTTHSHDHLTGGISRTSTPAPHENDTSSRQVQLPVTQNYNNSSSQQQFPSQESSHIGIYVPPTEPPLSIPTYQMNQNINNFSPPPTNSEPPKYTPSADQFRSKNNSDVILEAGSSNYNVNNIEEIKATLQTDRSIRMAFVRKVYFLLTLQLLLTIGLTILFMYSDPVKDFIKENQWLFFLSWIMTFISLLVLFWQRKRSPLNLLLLLLFTLFMSYGIGSVVSMYSSKVVLQAFLITFGVFLALEIFTFQSKYDFSSWGPFLYAGLWIVIFGSIIGWLFPYDRGYHIAISGFGALLFSAYIIYDTYMILNRVSPEEYILATVDLYLDVVNLFVAIIALIGGTDR